MMTDHLNHYLQMWDLSNPQPLATTPRGHIYTVSSGADTVVLKMFTEDGSEEKIGGLALRYYDGHGAVRLLRDDDGAQLLEYIEGGDLVPMVQGGDDEKAAHIIADVLSQLHRLPADKPPEGLTPLYEWFDALFKKAELDRMSGNDSIYVRAAQLADQLLTEQTDAYVLHGDIHHENIRNSAARGWVAIDPKGLYGERTYDIANTLYNPPIMPALVENETRLLKISAILADRLGIDRQRALAFVYIYGCLSASWWLEADEQDDSRGDTANRSHRGTACINRKTIRKNHREGL